MKRTTPFTRRRPAPRSRSAILRAGRVPS